MPTGIFTRKPHKQESKVKMSLSHKGKTPWNKGKKLGKNPAHSDKMKGRTPWNKGKSSTLETREKLSKIRKGKMLGSNHPQWKGGVSTIDKRCREMPEYKQWRSDVFTRDNWTCQTCMEKGYVTVHHIKSFALILRENNIKNVIEARICEELWDTKNGVTLCEECHKLTDNYKGRGRLTFKQK